jgi:hypothetical protein
MDDHYHAVARGVAVGTAAAGAYTYYSCAGVWHQPQYQGDRVVYVVVNEPR